MQNEQTVIGVDFGTLSARAVVVRVQDGKVLGEAAYAYPNGVLDLALPNGIPLKKDWALQHPKDYEEALTNVVRGAVKKSGVSKDCILSIALDFTGSTVIPVDQAFIPLCMLEQYKDRPHSYVKLWKHHGAKGEADRFTAAAAKLDPHLLSCNGGRISPECFFPKVLQVFLEDREIYDAAYAFIEAGDWLTCKMTGTLTRSMSAASLKAFYRKGRGYPTKEFFAAVHPDFQDVVAQKVGGALIPLSGLAGHLTKEYAQKLHLNQGTPVAAMQLDAPAALPGVGVSGEGQAMLTLGTSTGILICAKEERPVEGLCSLSEDGTLPGYYGYSAGQYGAGDILAWYVNAAMPSSYAKAAQDLKLSPLQYMTEKAAAIKPLQSGLIALDWWSGNRSRLVNTRLSGMILGMTLQTKPEEIFLALIEAIAMGTRMIFDGYEEKGLAIHHVYACGGIARKNPLMMQIYADVLGLPIFIADSDAAPAIGAAIFAATAAGLHKTVLDGVKAMNCLGKACYQPNAENHRLYTLLYKEYCLLHDYFGRGENDVMVRLKGEMCT